ncbi:MAG: amidohydrolase family protein, partial [Proteobacteria bacterium]|nr:amidohydrolase family protein [Pseudomonadota bacterium]
MTTIYRARRILTMNPSRPEATHVAVRDGRILGVGTLDELKGWGDYTLDERFANKVLMPGLVEGHSHTMEGTFWRYAYVGYFDRTDPDGRVWPGVGSIDAVVERLKEAGAKLADPKAPIAGRAIGVLHASGHIMNVNSKALELAGLLRAGVDHPGIPLGEDGLPTGEMKGPEAMMPVGPHVGFDRDILACDELGLRYFAKLCVRKGVTTAADLASLLPPDAVTMMQRVTGEEDFPVRVVSLRRMLNLAPKDLIPRAQALRAASTDRLRMGIIKIVVDGSIQGFSARLAWPGYYNGAPNGLWYVTPEELRAALALALEHGVQIHAHTNGDEATELVLDCLEEALAKHPARD